MVLKVACSFLEKEGRRKDERYRLTRFFAIYGCVFLFRRVAGTRNSHFRSLYSVFLEQKNNRESCPSMFRERFNSPLNNVRFQCQLRKSEGTLKGSYVTLEGRVGIVWTREWLRKSWLESLWSSTIGSRQTLLRDNLCPVATYHGAFPAVWGVAVTRIALRIWLTTITWGS